MTNSTVVSVVYPYEAVLEMLQPGRFFEGDSPEEKKIT